MRNIPFVFGGGLLLMVLLAAFLGPAISTHDPYRSQITKRLLPPSFMNIPTADPQFLLGTDPVGRDILTRLLHGARWSLGIAVTAALSAAVIGVLLGIFAGYFGGLGERLIMGFADVQLSIPAVLLAIAVVAVLGPNVRNLVLVLIITSWVLYARTVRAQVLSIKHREFIHAAHALGAGPFGTLWKHVLPNVLAPVIVIFSQQLGFMILMETALSFLGLGIQPPTPSWGGMINEARLYLPIAPWAVLFPGLALMVTVLAVNLLGDGLRDVLDPKTRP
jgi:peptide/nickel transport system permease protein